MSVYLVPTHHYLEEHIGFGVKLTQDMLSWPIYMYRCCRDKCLRENIIKKALQALLELNEFLCVVSIEVNEEKKFMYPAQRCLGTVYLDGVCIIKFSHDTRMDDYLFTYIDDWPEIDNEIPQKWSPAEWKEFFVCQIKEKVLNDLKNAKKAADKASEELKQQQATAQKVFEIISSG